MSSASIAPASVRDISGLLARHGANIEELVTDTSSAPMSGEVLFRAHVRLTVPPASDLARIRTDLERFSSELMVELRQIETVAGAAAARAAQPLKRAAPLVPDACLTSLRVAILVGHPAPHSPRRERARGRLSSPAAALRYLWALPNTAPGLVLIPPAVLAGGHVRMVDGVLEVHGPLVRTILRYCVPLPGGAAAITFGHVVLGRDEDTLAATRSHERGHVRQCEIWGPAFIPAYLLAGVWGWMSGAGAYQGNYFEHQARRWERVECDTATG